MKKLSITVLSLCLMMTIWVYSATRMPFYFYNPETNVTKFASLKQSFDMYLSGFGDFEFQPFKTLVSLESQIQANQNCIVLVPSWYFRQPSSAIQLDPLLVAKSGQAITVRKKLVSKRDVRYFNHLKGATVATSGDKKIAQDLLAELTQDPVLAATIKILIVPKDIDALMAVEFGMAKAAITTETSLTKLKGIAPKQYGKLVVLSESNDQFLPIVAVPKANESSSAFVAVIKDMQAQRQGKMLLKRLGFDAWERITPKIRRELGT